MNDPSIFVDGLPLQLALSRKEDRSFIRAMTHLWKSSLCAMKKGYGTRAGR